MLALLLVYRAAMHVGGLARCWKGVENVAELSISLLTCLKLCGREFQPHCGIFVDSKVSSVDIVVS